MKPSKNAIITSLHEAETKFNLKKNTLVEIYEEEARVVFMARRRGLSSNLRKILQKSALE